MVDKPAHIRTHMQTKKPTLPTCDKDALKMVEVGKGDRSAFETLFDTYAPALHHFVLRFVGNASIAEELVQEIFLKIYRAAPQYTPKGSFKTFLYRVATNHCLNEIRRAYYRERFEPLENIQTTKEWSDSKITNAETDLIGSRLARQLQAFILELPENQRSALLLHRLEGLSYLEISDVMDLTLGAVKSLIYRAKTTLQRRLEAWDEEQHTT